ncbi:MAG: response regulator [Candidatus Thiodiazotropha taylori]
MSEQTRNILLIEDDTDHAELAKFYIHESSEKMTIVTIEDGAAALEYIQAIREGSQPMPWLILLDLKVPKYDGHEILSVLKTDEDLSIIPVVIFSTSNSRKDICEALRTGANGYIVKPMQPDSYGNVFEKILAYWELSQHHICYG